jgi:hypothetical protein
MRVSVGTVGTRIWVTHGLLLCKVTRSPQNYDDGVILEFDGTVQPVSQLPLSGTHGRCQLISAA